MSSNAYFLFAILCSPVIATITPVNFSVETSIYRHTPGDPIFEATTYRHTRIATITSSHVTVITLKYDEIAESKTEPPLDWLVGALERQSVTTEDLTFYLRSGSNIEGGNIATKAVTTVVTVDESDWHKVPASAQASYTSFAIMSMASKHAAERAAACSSHAASFASSFYSSKFHSSMMAAALSSEVASSSTSSLTSEPIASSTALSALPFRDASDAIGATNQSLSQVMKLVVSCLPINLKVHGALSMKKY